MTAVTTANDTDRDCLQRWADILNARGYSCRVQRTIKGSWCCRLEYCPAVCILLAEDKDGRQRLVGGYLPPGNQKLETRVFELDELDKLIMWIEIVVHDFNCRLCEAADGKANP